MEFIEYTTRNRIGYITLNRPEKRNALSAALVSELKSAFAAAEKDAMVKVVVLKAKGEAFCAGADLSYLQQLQDFSFEQNLQDSDHLKELFLQIYTLDKVVIAQVEGDALAGGCGLATVCDFTFSVPEAGFGYTEVRIGFVPAIVMVFLIRKIGEAKAKRLLFSGDIITAQEAMQYGLINKVCDKDEIASEIDQFAQRLIFNSATESLVMTKRMLTAIQSMTLEESLTFASQMNAKARTSKECRRGIAAFLNKEKLTW